MTKFSSILLLLFSLIAPGLLLAQQDLPTGEVDVIRSFNARLIETQKFDLQPELPPVDTMTKRQQYNIAGRPMNIDYPPPRIRPVALRPEENPEMYPGFARLGGGFPKLLYGEGSYTLANNETFMMDLDLFHHSANNTANVENQRFSYTDAGLEGAYFHDFGFGVKGRAGYTQDNVFFYGYNNIPRDTSEAPLSFASDDVRQSFKTISLGGEIFNSKPTQADFDYSAEFDFYNLRDNYAARENGFDLQLQGTKWFQGQNALRVLIRTDFTGFQDTAKQSLNNFFFNPSFTYHGDIFRAKVGGNIASSNDEFFFFPDVEVAVNVIENILSAFAGVEGTLHKNNFRNLSDYNPFITSRPDIRNTSYNHFYGGITGELLGADYQAQAGYKRANDLALYLANDDTIPRFNALYDTVDIFTIKGSLTMPLFEGLELTGSIAQNFYSPKNQEKAWHLPALDVNVGATYITLDEKLSLRADLFIQNGVPFRDEKGEARNLNALLDLSAGAEYFFTENIGAFAKVNNILDNKRERWQYYPVLGLNAMAGVSARF